MVTNCRLGSESGRGYVLSTGKWERPRGRCQEEEEGRRNSETDKSKTKPVSSWRCQRQAGAMKALPRLVWSLVFLGFGMHLVSAEEQGSQVQQRMSEKDFYQTLQKEMKELTEQMDLVT